MHDLILSEADELRRVYGEPSELARKKCLPALDRHCRAFIALSPFLVIGTAAADGAADCSPRGDAPGFVAVLDERTLVIPDRPGNNRIDSMANLVENPNIALIFFVPGFNETLRVNGKAAVTRDPALLGPLAIDGKTPRAGILVEVEEAFLHCAKALIRSRLWDPERRRDRKSFPSFGRILADQIAGVDAGEADARIEDAYRTRLY